MQYHSERNLVVTEDRGQSGNTPSRSRPLSDKYNNVRSMQSSTANISRRSTLSPLLQNLSDEQLQDDVPQLGWLALSGSETHSPGRGGSEQEPQSAVCHRCAKSSPRSDRFDVLPSNSCGFNETPSSRTPIFHIAENVYDNRRRLSDGALLGLDNGLISARKPTRSSTTDRGNRWSLRRRQHRPSDVELYEEGLQSTPLSLKTRLSVGVTNLDSITDASIRCSDRLTNSSRCNRQDNSKEEVLERATCRFRTQQRCSQSAEADRSEYQRIAVDSGTFSKSKASVSSLNTPRAFKHAGETRDRVEISWKHENQTTTTDVPENRSMLVKLSQWRRQGPTADNSISPSSTSISETANHFQMSTFRRIRNSISTATATAPDILSASAATLKRHHTIATKERKASKVLGIIFAVFLLLWTPFFVVNVLSVVCESCLDALGSTAMSSIVWLGYASSLANPIVYTMFSTSFRTVFYRIVTCRVCHKRRGVQSGTSYPLSRQVTMGDGIASGRQAGQQTPAEIAGLINSGTSAAAASK